MLSGYTQNIYRPIYKIKYIIIWFLIKYFYYLGISTPIPLFSGIHVHIGQALVDGIRLSLDGIQSSLEGLDFGLIDPKYDGCREEIIRYL